MSHDCNAEQTPSNNRFDCVSDSGLGQINFGIVLHPSAQRGLYRRTWNCFVRSPSRLTLHQGALGGPVQDGRRGTDRSVDSWEGRFGARRDARDTDLLHPS